MIQLNLEQRRQIALLGEQWRTGQINFFRYHMALYQIFQPDLY